VGVFGQVAPSGQRDVNPAEPVPASQSRQAAVKADPHAQGALQVKASEFAKDHKTGKPINLFKVGCSCGGFVGCWQSSPQLAFSSHARHVNGARVEFR
jgi:hypothetical protein